MWRRQDGLLRHRHGSELGPRGQRAAAAVELQTRRAGTVHATGVVNMLAVVAFSGRCQPLDGHCWRNPWRELKRLQIELKLLTETREKLPLCVDEAVDAERTRPFVASDCVVSDDGRSEGEPHLFKLEVETLAQRVACGR